MGSDMFTLAHGAGWGLYWAPESTGIPENEEMDTEAKSAAAGNSSPTKTLSAFLCKLALPLSVSETKWIHVVALKKKMGSGVVALPPSTMQQTIQRQAPHLVLLNNNGWGHIRVRINYHDAIPH